MGYFHSSAVVSICRWSRCPIGRGCCSQGFVVTHSWSVLCPDVTGGLCIGTFDLVRYALVSPLTDCWTALIPSGLTHG